MNILVCLFISVLITGTGDPGEDAAVATIVFLLDGKLVLLRPSARGESLATDLKYDMRILSDKIEFFMLLSTRGDELSVPLLNGSIWAWDGKQLNVRFPAFMELIR
jgi:RAB6A-GEF complex partner protein 1